MTAALERYDVVVVGAGPAGSAAAYTLASHGARVLLLDQAEFPREKVCGDGLTPRAVSALHAMGVLARVLPQARPISAAGVTAPDGGAVRTAVPTPAGLPAMLVVPRIVLDDAIRRHAAAAGAVFLGGAHVEDIVSERAGVAVRVRRHGATVSHAGRLAIVATGASITLLRRMGLLRRPPAVMLAARTYVEGTAMAPDCIEFRFGGVPLPGYGWIFPLSAGSANVGVGFVVTRRGRRSPPPARHACEQFLGTLEPLGVREAARPIRSYPLRIDFPASPVHAGRVLLAGEAAGLVNPLTGEGIDYALESGRLAAEHALSILATPDGSPQTFNAGAAAYERALRGRFERLFALCRLLQGVTARPALLNRLVRLASRREDLTTALVDVVLGNTDPVGPGAVRSALRRVLVLAR